MSRSIRASTSSRVSRDTSASNSVTGRRLGPSVASWPRRARPTQFLSVLSDMLRRLAASGIVNFCSRISCTACSRNSVVYFCGGTRSISHLQPTEHRSKASTFSSLPQNASAQECWAYKQSSSGSRVCLQKVTHTVSWSGVSTVERGCFGSMGASSTWVRVFHFATVFWFIS